MWMHVVFDYALPPKCCVVAFHGDESESVGAINNFTRKADSAWQRHSAGENKLELLVFLGHARGRSKQEY